MASLLARFQKKRRRAVWFAACLQGARSIIMSLWKVENEATQELMVGFYKQWQTEKGNQRSAFLKAQKELKAKYPNPYYWRAFVMVGE